MAEGFARKLHSDTFEVYSAGIQADGLNPRTVLVMSETGIDISNHTSNMIDEYRDIEFDYIITLCGHAREHCHVFPGKTAILHRGFDDPYVLAKKIEIESGKIEVYRRIRDEIQAFIENITDFLNQN